MTPAAASKKETAKKAAAAKKAADAKKAATAKKAAEKRAAAKKAAAGKTAAEKAAAGQARTNPGDAEAAAAETAEQAVATRRRKKESNTEIGDGLTKPQLERASREELFGFCQAAIVAHGDKLSDPEKITSLNDKTLTKNAMSTLLLEARALGEYEGQPDRANFPPSRTTGDDDAQGGTAAGKKEVKKNGNSAPNTRGPDTQASAPQVPNTQARTSTMASTLSSLTGTGGASLVNALASARSNADVIKASVFLEGNLGAFFEFDLDPSTDVFSVSVTSKGREVFRDLLSPALAATHHKVLEDMAQVLSFYKNSDLFREEAKTVNAQLAPASSDHSGDTIKVHEDPSQLGIRVWVGYAMALTMSYARHESRYVYGKMDELCQQVTLLYTGLQSQGTLNVTTLRRIGQLADNLDEEHFSEAPSLSGIVGGVKKHRVETPAASSVPAEPDVPKVNGGNARANREWCTYCRKAGHAVERCRNKTARDKQRLKDGENAGKPAKK